MIQLIALAITTCLISIGSLFAVYDAATKNTTVVSIRYAQVNEPLDTDWYQDLTQPRKP